MLRFRLQSRDSPMLCDSNSLHFSLQHVPFRRFQNHNYYLATPAACQNTSVLIYSTFHSLIPHDQRANLFNSWFLCLFVLAYHLHSFACTDSLFHVIYSNALHCLANDSAFAHIYPARERQLIPLVDSNSEMPFIFCCQLEAIVLLYNIDYLLI